MRFKMKLLCILVACISFSSADLKEEINSLDSTIKVEADIKNFFTELINSISAAINVEVNSHEPEVNIIGGDPANIKNFLYMGALLNKRGNLMCGASLISKDTVVTAAHCVDNIDNITELSLRFGSTQWRNGGQRIFVKEAIVHEDYMDVDRNPINDIALLILAKRVSTRFAAPISLSRTGQIYKRGTLGVVSGWGTTSFGGIVSDKLRKVIVPIFDHNVCYVTYGEAVTTWNICAGYWKGGKDSCQGDSGGPYVINKVLAGIVSYGKGCGIAHYPGVYTSIAPYNKWIRYYAEI